MTNLLLHGIDVPSNVRHDNTLARLPNGVFAPYTGIKTNLLFFTNGMPAREVWYYEHPYPPGAKNYNKTKPIGIEEFDTEKKWWGKPDKHGLYSKREETGQAWRVSAEDIARNGYNLDIKNPHSSDDGPGDFSHLLPEYEKLLKQLAETKAQLKAELQAALGR
ncbi:MAG: N-6 DNA methylase [Luteolibacter sp.]